MASAGCDPRQAAISLWWQPPQAALPTNVGASAGGAGEAAPQTPIAAITTTAADAVRAGAVAASRGNPTTSATTPRVRQGRQQTRR